MNKDIVHVLVGTYTRNTDSEGIYLLSWDKSDDKLRIKSIQEQCSDPNFLAASAQASLVFAVNEGPDCAWLSAYRTDSNGGLVYLDKVRIPGEAPCHISTNREGTAVYFANYVSGEIGRASFSPDNGAFLELNTVQCCGHSIGERQKSAHPHAVHLTPGERWVLVPDLGTDTVYCFDAALASPSPACLLRVAPGDGPRHIAFHPFMPAFYLVCEINNCVYAYAFDEDRPAFAEWQRLELLPEIQGEWIASEIEVSSDGCWLYCANRSWGDAGMSNGRITSFKIDANGRLSSRSISDCQGAHPRSFCLGGNDRVLIANQYSDEIVLCSCDTKTGRINLAKDRIAIPQPTFVGIL